MRTQRDLHAYMLKGLLLPAALVIQIRAGAAYREEPVGGAATADREVQ